MILTLLSTLIPTIVIELVVLWLLLERRRRVLLSSVVVNVLTNVPLSLYFIYHQSTWGTLLIAELIVVVVETVWYRVFAGHWRMAAIYSVLCNGISLLIGLLFQLICMYIEY